MTAKDQRERIIELLADGQSLSAICELDGMPSRRAVQKWMLADEEFSSQIARARQEGYDVRAERAVEAAKNVKDAALGRLAFDAERWYLGKLSNAFSDKQKHEHSGPDGSPIKTEGTSRLKVEGLNDEQLRALASIPVQPE